MGFSMLNLWNQHVHNFRDSGFRNRYYYNMSKFPILGDFMRMEDYRNYWNDYFANRPDAGGWANVKYPTLMMGSGNASTGIASGHRYVSKNLKSLYR